MARPIHAMLRVLDERRSVDFYARAFGLVVVGRFEFDTFTLLYLAEEVGGFELELTVNHGRTEPYAQGEGYGHMAFRVDDIAADHARLTAQGFAPRGIVEFLREGSMFARFFFVADPDGYQIEVVQTSGRFT